mmetsp:Transcript_57416/g.135126  ORF Transcript_57416/g.135126 Transcript_57416/m.135126 type:complete len:131 (-) Transcript_57416:410-802(-)
MRGSRLTVWDVSGQERFRAVARSYFRGAHVVILVVDGNRLSQTDHSKTKNWVKTCAEFNVDTSDIVLVVGKAEEEDLPVELAEDLARTCNVSGPVFTSSKTGMNVDRCFALCLRRCVRSANRWVRRWQIS